MKVLKYGMVGGGPGAFIGDAHRRSIALDGKAKLVAGSFSSSYEKTLQQGEALNIEKDRLYATYEEMAKAEAAREDGIDFVVVVTPNSSHYAICKAFLEAGIAVACDKPLACDSAQCEELAKIAKEKGILFAVTYTYAGHLTAKYARYLIESGEIGEVRVVQGEYPQGWLADEDITGNKQAEWRTDPAKSGRTNALGDVGTHIENTVSMMTGLKIKRVLAKMDVMVPGRKLDDNSTVMVEYDNGASGVYWASQVAIGHDNSLRVRIYGSKGSILWFQEHPEEITVIKHDGTITEVHRGHGAIPACVDQYRRLPSGHPEGYFEALGNIYSNFIDCIIAKKEGTFDPKNVDFPTVEEGVEGVKFVEACLKSSENGNIWVDIH